MELVDYPPELDETTIKPTSRTGRKRGGVWRYFREPVDQSRKSRRAECSFCEKSMVAQSDRMRSHIQHACLEAPDNVKSELWKEEIASCSLSGGRILHHDELGPIKLYRKPSKVRKMKPDDFQVPQEEFAMSIFHGTKRFETCEMDTQRQSLSIPPNQSLTPENQDEDSREKKTEETKIRDKYDAFGSLVSNQIRSLPVDQGNTMMKRISEILFENY